MRIRQVGQREQRCARAAQGVLARSVHAPEAAVHGGDGRGRAQGGRQRLARDGPGDVQGDFRAERDARPAWHGQG